MNRIESNSGSIIDSTRAGKDCTCHHITATDANVFGRPRAELEPDQDFQIGNTVSYKTDVLIPSDNLGYSPNGEPIQSPVLQFHQFQTVEPGVRLSMRTSGNLMICTGYHPDGEFFNGIDSVNVPEEWVTWDIQVKWSTGRDGWIKIYRYNQLVFEYLGANCVEDGRGAPHFRYGPQNGEWIDRQQYIRFYYSNVLIERLP